MPNTNFQTIFQMPGIVNNIVKQATGRDSVSQIDMDFVTVGQDKQTVPHEIDYTDIARFVNNNQLPLTVLAKITAVQSGTGDPSPENVRPITGWTGMNVSRMGKNLFDQDTVYSDIKTADNTYYAMGYRFLEIKVIIPSALIGKQITFSAYLSGENMPTNSRVQASVNGVEKRGNALNTNGWSSVTFTPETASDYIVISYGSNGTRYMTASSCQLEIGEARTDYEPYQGEIYDITFPDEAGTVYGGVLNVTTGVLTLTMGEIESYNGETLPGVWMSDRDVYAEDATPTEGAQVVYELAEPVTYECDPEEIKSLIGSNNVWADTGDVSVSYTSYIPVP